MSTFFILCVATTSGRKKMQKNEQNINVFFNRFSNSVYIIREVRKSVFGITVAKGQKRNSKKDQVMGKQERVLQLDVSGFRTSS